ncbi:MAG TPA: hypothetical protein PLE32_12750 [Haliscomenobacter sp.]|nr:hypothetical protein [Haliscomenobacter sp.]
MYQRILDIEPGDALAYSDLSRLFEAMESWEDVVQTLLRWKEHVEDTHETAALMLRDVQVSPGTMRERQYEEQNQIQDGWVYEYDTRGNVKKDTAGNDIKYPNKVTLRAMV